jgi:hypothetical protein
MRMCACPTGRAVHMCVVQFRSHMHVRCLNVVGGGGAFTCISSSHISSPRHGFGWCMHGYTTECRVQHGTANRVLVVLGCTCSRAEVRATDAHASLCMATHSAPACALAAIHDGREEEVQWHMLTSSEDAALHASMVRIVIKPRNT